MSESDKTAALKSLRKLATKVASITHAAGLSLEDVQLAFEQAYDGLDQRKRFRKSIISVESEYSHLIGSYLSIWRNLADYTDDHGNTKPLPRYGPAPSMSSLYAELVAREPKRARPGSEDIVFDLLLDHGIVKSVDDMHYLPTQSWFQVNTDTQILSGTLIEYLTRYAIAIQAGLEQGGQPYFMAHVSRLPNELIPQLVAKVSDQGIKSIEGFDDFLESNNLPPGSDIPSSHAGVAMFMFYEDSKDYESD